MNLYLHLKWLFRKLSNSFLKQEEQSVVVLTRERCRTANISSRHYMYSIKVEKPNEPAGAF